MIWFLMDLVLQFSISVPGKIKDIGKGNCMLWFMIRYLVYLLTGLRLASKFCTWVTIIFCLRFCLPYFGSCLSMFLFTKVIYYPWILTIHFLFIPLYIGPPWIYCCIFQIGKMLLCPQKNLIRVRLLLGLLFWYLSYLIQVISLQMSVELSSSQTGWVSGTI